MKLEWNSIFHLKDFVLITLNMLIWRVENSGGEACPQKKLFLIDTIFLKLFVERYFKFHFHKVSWTLNANFSTFKRKKKW